MKATLTIEIEFNPEITDADAIGNAVDHMLETAMSTPGILEEYGDPEEFGIGQTYVLDPLIEAQRIQFARIIWEMDAACQSQEMLDDMAESMDLEPAELQELIAGAIKVFEKAKERATGVVLSA